MDDFTFYFVFGLQHILSLNALDHVLFLGVLTAGYTFRQWKKLALLVTAFTIGHCLTLALSVYELLQFPARLAEFFIPFTIVIAAAYNISRQKQNGGVFIYLMALVFGLIHGMGFAGTLRFMLAA
ncbi:MAG: HupE/UreJ family protein, partial [Ferruginibacter sp.]